MELMNVFYILVALLFLLSPVAAGVFGTLWMMQKKENTRLKRQMDMCDTSHKAIP